MIIDLVVIWTLSGILYGDDLRVVCEFLGCPNIYIT